jgi:hypothetical protein
MGKPMRFEYLTLADAANTSAEGKLNALGIGVRVLTVPGLPAMVPVTILGAVQATVEEAGDYDVVVTLVDPADERRIAVLSDRGTGLSKGTD